MPLPYDLDYVRATPGMYLRKTEFDTAVAYIAGLNASTHGCFLTGFREWLVPKLDGGANLAWSEIVLELAFPGVADAREELQHTFNHAKAIEYMFESFEQFWAERSRPNGLRGIYLRFQAWLEAQEWYGPASADWISKEDMSLRGTR